MGGEAEGEKRESEGGTDKRVGAGERQRAKGERGAGVGVEWEGAAKNQKKRRSFKTPQNAHLLSELPVELVRNSTPRSCLPLACPD